MNTELGNKGTWVEFRRFSLCLSPTLVREIVLLVRKDVLLSEQT